MRDVDLQSAADTRVWDYAKTYGMIVISKDADFRQRSVLYGHPPKVIGLLLGNCPTAAVEALLRSSMDIIRNFEADPEAAFLELP